MKIPARNIDSFVKQPPNKLLAVLIYGPDEGLIRERFTIMGKTVVEDLKDPFNVVDLTADAIINDPARLMDEACAISMMGGRRLIRIRNATDKLTKIFKEFFDNVTQCDSLIIVEASDLAARSRLRALFEKVPEVAAAIPCYVEDERAVSQFIQGTLRQNGFQISPDALQLMSSNLVGDRAIVKNEIEKICLYLYDKEAKTIDLEDVIACTDNNSALSLDNIALYTASGNITEMNKTLKQIIAEGISPIAILRIVQNYFRRLQITQLRLSSGDNRDTAIKKLRPPLFFKVKPLFEQQLNSWSLKKITIALEKLNETEAACKKTGAPVNVLCDRILFALCHMARAGNKGGRR